MDSEKKGMKRKRIIDGGKGLYKITGFHTFPEEGLIINKGVYSLQDIVVELRDYKQAVGESVLMAQMPQTHWAHDI